jgi:hypothetical protein
MYTPRTARGRMFSRRDHPIFVRIPVWCSRTTVYCLGSRAGGGGLVSWEGWMWRREGSLHTRGPHSWQVHLPLMIAGCEIDGDDGCVRCWWFEIQVFWW